MEIALISAAAAESVIDFIVRTLFGAGELNDRFAHEAAP
jgi:hypothetical protein